MTTAPPPPVAAYAYAAMQQQAAAERESQNDAFLNVAAGEFEERLSSSTAPAAPPSAPAATAHHPSASSVKSGKRFYDDALREAEAVGGDAVSLELRRQEDVIKDLERIRVRFVEESGSGATGRGRYAELEAALQNDQESLWQNVCAHYEEPLLLS